MQFFAVWILPTVLYNIFIQFGEIGHGMSWGLGLLLILGESIVALCADLSQMLTKLWKRGSKGISQALQNSYWKGRAYAFVLGPIILFNLFMFFYDFDKGGPNFYSFERYRQFNYVDVVKNNGFFKSKVNFIKRNFQPRSSLIVSDGAFSHQVMYRIPEACVIQANIIYKKNNFGFFIFNAFKRSYYKDKRDFIIPKGIDKLILFDDIYIPYFQDRGGATCFEIGNSNKLLVYDVSPGQIVVFDYHSIRVE